MNAYGLTETSDDTNHEIMDSVPRRERVPLGYPINNVSEAVSFKDLAAHPILADQAALIERRLDAEGGVRFAPAPVLIGRCATTGRTAA